MSQNLQFNNLLYNINLNSKLNSIPNCIYQKTFGCFFGYISNQKYTNTIYEFKTSI